MIHFTEIVAQADAAPVADLQELAGDGDILVLAPHPDDESLAMGGAIAAAEQAGRRVHVVIVTDGTRSHPNSVSHSPAVLENLRRREAEEAVGILTGMQPELIWLGYPDMAAPEDETVFMQIAARLAPVMENVTAIWTTWNGDPHPDHQRVFRMAKWLTSSQPGLRMFACPVWGRVQGPVSGAASCDLKRFPTAAFRDTKARAIAAHVSQMTDLISDDPEGFQMPGDLVAYFVESDEIFIPS